MKAVLLDFYGTVVHEAYELLDHIAEVFQRAGAQVTAQEVGDQWWQNFSRECDLACGKSFRLQKELYASVLEKLQQKFGVRVDAPALVKEIVEFSVSSKPFEDSLRFIEECPIPCYILSNIDTAELVTMIGKIGIAPKDFYTSEMARAYKPAPEIFLEGLSYFGLNAADVVYAGDSLRNDYWGARGAGIKSVWLNRLGQPVPQGVVALPDLYSLLAKLSDL